MHLLNRIVVAGFVLVGANPALRADIEFGDAIPTEIVEQLLGSNFGSPPKLYADIFEAFPDFGVPAGLEAVASVDHGVSQRVILLTDLDDAAARAALVAAFGAAGWIEMPAYGAGAPRTGFVSAETPPQGAGLCSNQLGRMNISLGDGSGGRYVYLAHTPLAAFGGQRRSCEEEIEMIRQGPGGRPRAGMDIIQHVPTLVLPESDVVSRMPNVGFAGGGGSSSNDYETRGNLAITWSGDRLMQHFAPQVLEQGWQPDAQVSGAQAVFGSWTKRIDGNDYLGTLTLVETAADNWDLKFRIVRTGDVPANAGVLFSR